MTRDLNTDPITERWGRWLWKDTGPGRWHALASLGMGQTENGTQMPAAQTACGRMRTLPVALTDTPDEPICKKCRGLDDLRKQFADKDLSKDDAAKVPVAVLKAPALSEDVPMPMFPETDPSW
jgi:hypothetical protein